MKINKNKLIKEYLSKSHNDVEIISENNLEVIVRILLMDKIKKEPTTKELLKQILMDVSELKSDVNVLKSDVSTLKSDVADIKSRLTNLEVDMSIIKLEAKNHGWNIGK